MIAFVVIGILAGSLSFAAALVLGASFWSALLLYSLVGAACVLGAALILVFGRRGGAGLLQDMPVPEHADTSAEPEPSPAYLTQRGMRILAVDDDPMILGLIPRIAAEIGCADTTISSSGAQALSFLEQSSGPFDCVLLDINMPGIDGIELCARIRRIPAYRDTPIIMLTAMKDVDYLDRAFRAGATDYITKPFDVIAFGTCLRAVQDGILLDHLETGRVVSGSQDAVAATAAGAGDGGWIVPVPGSVPGGEALIEQEALQNYLARLSGAALARAYVTVVGVQRGAGPAEGPVALAPVVRALNAVFTNQPCVMSYIGDGQFVLVSSAANLPDSAGLERAVEEALQRASGPAEPALLPDFTVSVGQPVRPVRDRTNRAKTAMENARRHSQGRGAAGRTASRR